MVIRRDKSNYLIQSVAHALDVLEQFFDDVDELGVTELSKRLKLHKNNVFRLLATLEARGYIEQNKATENYRLGIKCLHLGRRYIEHMGLVRQARPILAIMAKQCRETVYVAVYRREGVIPLEAADPEDRAVRITSPVGHSMPLHATAVGKVHLAFDTDEQIRASLPEVLNRYTDRTITDRAQLFAQLESVARSGYAIDIGEYIDEVSSIAVPIRDYTRSVVGSIAIAGPSMRMPEERISSEITPIILDQGRELSHRLGFNE